MNLIVDGYCLGNPGKAGYKGVNLDTYETVFEQHIGVATNNIAEFLAICHALHYLTKNNLPLEVMSDSKTAMSWVNNRKVNSTYKGNITARVQKAEAFIKTLDKFKLTKWDTKALGENPADFGHKGQIMENTLENKKKFFAQYWSQKLVIWNDNLLIKPKLNIILNETDDQDKLELRSIT